MEVTSVKGPEFAFTGAADKDFGVKQAEGTANVQTDDGQTTADAPDSQTKIGREKLEQITQDLNKFVEGLDTNLRFMLHDGTHQLMVQIVDSKTNKVLREFPPHEMLDTIAKIREYIGALLDKKA